MRTVGRRLGRIGMLAAIALGLLVLGPAPNAQAHAYLVGSNPADGASLPAAPTQLRLQFSETVVLDQTRIDVVAANGTVARPDRLRIEGSSDDPEDPVELVGDLPALAPGAYRISWQTLSRDDLHRTAGVLVFGIGQRVAPVGVSEPMPRAEEAALRWTLFLAVSLALGGGLAARLCQRAGGRSLIAECVRSQYLSAVGAVVALPVSWLLLAEQASSAGLPIGRLLGSDYGLHWTVREAGLALLVGWALRARPLAARGSPGLLVVAGAVLTAVGSAELGHARGAGLTALLADSAHLLAAAIWSGAVLVLALAGLRGLRAGGERARAMRAAIRGFGRPAAVCVATVLVTGVYLSSTVIGSVDALLLTFYGRLLLVKLAAVLIVLALGLLNHRRVRRPGGPVRRGLAADALTMAAILGLAALLISSQPAREPQYIRPVAATTLPVVDGAAADLQQTLAVRPNLPGHDVLLAEVFDTRRPAPAPISAVFVTVTEVDSRTIGPVPAQRLADGRWSAPLELVSPGRALVTLSVRRPGMADTVRTFPWVIGGGGQATRPATVSDAPLAAPLRWLAALLGLLAVAGGLWRLRRPAGPAGTEEASRPGRDLVSTGVG